MNLTDFREHVGSIVVGLNEVSLAFVADIEVGMGVLHDEILEIGFLRDRDVDQSIRSRKER